MFVYSIKKFCEKLVLISVELLIEENIFYSDYSNLNSILPKFTTILVKGLIVVVNIT
jgi:hypothetical protein